MNGFAYRLVPLPMVVVKFNQWTGVLKLPLTLLPSAAA